VERRVQLQCDYIVVGVGSRAVAVRFIAYLDDLKPVGTKARVAGLEDGCIQRDQLAMRFGSPGGLTDNTGERRAIGRGNKHEVESHVLAELAQLIFNGSPCRGVAGIPGHSTIMAPAWRNFGASRAVSGILWSESPSRPAGVHPCFALV